MRAKSLYFLYCFVLLSVLFNNSARSQIFYHQNREYEGMTMTAQNIIDGCPNNSNNGTVINDMWYQMSDPNIAPHLQVKQLRAFVKASVDHNDPNIYAKYTYRILFKIKGYTVPGDNNVFTETTDFLTVSYDPDSVYAYQDVNLKMYYGYYKVDIQILDVINYTCLTAPTPCTTPPTVGYLDVGNNCDFTGMGKNWKIDIETDAQVFDKELPENSSWETAYGNNVDISVTRTIPTGTNNLKVSWNIVSTNEMPRPCLYELEWTYVDDNKYLFNTVGNVTNSPVQASMGLSDVRYNFKNNSTRIITDKQEYNIPLIYSRGYLVYRVRLLRPDVGQYKTNVYSKWSVQNDEGTVGSVPTLSYYNILPQIAHLTQLYNWDYQMSFAEEGKSKSIVGYFDGLLKKRQSVTRMNSLVDQTSLQPNQVIVNEQFYDYEGRVGLQTLAIPVVQPKLSYVADFALSNTTSARYKASDFDHKNFTQNGLLAPLSNSSAASNYFSPSNVLLGTTLQAWKYLKRLPDAEGFPLIRTKYTPDDGRITEEGGAGPALQLGLGHETKNFYLPAESYELNKYFGLNIGKSAFYEKTITKDPNNQLSFQISNNQGKVMMSGLMGYDQGSTLVAPDYVTFNNGTGFPFVDVLYGNTQLWTGTTKKFNKPFFIEMTGPIPFHYNLNIQNYSPCSGAFLKVGVKYDVKVLNDYGFPTTLTSGTLGSNGVMSSSNPLTLTNNSLSYTSSTIGKGYIDYSVSYDPNDVKNVVNDLLVNHYPSCLKTKDDFLTNNLEEANTDCDEEEENEISECQTYKEALVAQLFPMSKYGRYEMQNLTVNGAQVNAVVGQYGGIFGIVGWTGGQSGSPLIESFDHTNPTQSVATPIYRYQYFLSTMPGNYEVFNANNISYTVNLLKSMPVNDFIMVFNDNVAEYLLPMHPEYCQYLKLYCNDHDGSNNADVDFIKKIQSVKTFAEAQALNFTDAISLSSIDPFRDRVHDLLTAYNPGLWLSWSSKFYSIQYFNPGSSTINQASINYLVFKKLFCYANSNCDYSVAEINAMPTESKNAFIKEMIRVYMSNRGTRIAKWPLVNPIPCPNLGGTGIPIGMIDIGPDANPENVIHFMYASANDDIPTNGFDQAGLDLINGIVGQSVTDMVDEAEDYNSGDLGYGEYADEIIRKLQNCRDANGGALNFAAIKTAIVNYMVQNGNGNSVWKGGLEPAGLASILQNSFGITLNDLCNPFLVDYLQRLDQVPGNVNCFDKEFYYYFMDFFNTNQSGLYLIARLASANPGTMQPTGSATIAVNPASSNKLEQMFGQRFGYTSTFNLSYKVHYNNTLKAFTFYFYTGTFTYANSVSIMLKLEQEIPLPNSSYYSGLTLSWDHLQVLGAQPSPIDYDMMEVECNQELTAMSGDNSFKGKMWFQWEVGVIVAEFSGLIKGLVMPKEFNEQSSCLTCVEMKKAYEGFLSELGPQTQNNPSAYEILGKNHPFYEDAVRSYYNFYFRKSHSSTEYLEFMKSCNLTEHYRIPAYYTYMSVKANALNSINVVQTALENYQNGDYKTFRRFYVYQGSGTDARLYVDMTSFPKDKIKSIMEHVAVQVAANTGGTTGVTAPTIYYNELEKDIPGFGSIFSFADLYVPTSENWTPTTSNSNIGYSTTNVNVKDGSTVYAYKKFRFTLNSSNISAHNLSDAMYQYETNIIPDATHNFTNFSLYESFLNADNLATAKQDYLKYVYNHSINDMFDQAEKDALLAQFAPAALQANVNQFTYTNNFNSFDYISYFNPDKDANSGDLFIRKNPGSNGLTELNNLLSFVNNSSTPNSPFPANVSNFNQTAAFNNQQVNLKFLTDHILWYNMVDQTTKKHKNVWIRFPGYLSKNQISVATLNGAIQMIVASERTRRFKANCNTSGFPTFQVDGKTDFDLSNATNEVYEMVMLCPDNAPNFDTISTCYEQQMASIYNGSEEDYQRYLDSVRRSYVSSFEVHIKNNIADKLEAQMPQMKYAITLYSYDRAGNLMYTVPPAGVDDIEDFVSGQNNINNVNKYIDGSYTGLLSDITAPHKKVSNYYYNSRDQLVSQTTPDAGVTDYFYDRSDRLIFTQNAQQKADGRFAYLLYDGQSRVVQTGVVVATMNFQAYVDDLKNMTYANSMDQIAAAVLARMRIDVIHTTYDNELIDLSTKTGMSKQENLRNRVATISKFRNLVPNAAAGTNFDIALHYSYDPSGNAKTLTYDMPKLEDVKQRYKRIDYDYDLYSGKVKLMSYNRSFADQFYQRYEYDDDNKVTKTHTSKDGLIWDQDAEYTYFPHGPLARLALGELEVQGVDYAYTLQGWLKNINGDAPTPLNDPGGDDGVGPGISVHQPDLGHESIYYFEHDYKSIDPTDNTGTTNTTMLKIPEMNDPTKSLYNGNIAAAVSIPGYFPSLYTDYRYDQLNRIKAADYRVPDYAVTSTLLKRLGDNLGGTILSSQTSLNLNANDFYRSGYTYDLDGNIKSMKRYGFLPQNKYSYTTGTKQAFLMDDLVYFYENQSQTNNLNPKNRLINFTDGIEHVGSSFTNDLPKHTDANAANVYRLDYDAIGNMKKDESIGLSSILWDQFGKVTQVNKTDNTMAFFGYDPLGNRFRKQFHIGQSNIDRNEYYIRDASGNILAVYRQLLKYKTGGIKVIAQHILGLSSAGADLHGAFGTDGGFVTHLMAGIMKEAPGFVNDQVSNKTLGYFITQNAEMRKGATGITPNLVTHLMANEPTLVTAPLIANYDDNVFRPMLEEGSVANRLHMLAMLTDTTDTLTMNLILDSMGYTGLRVANTTDFVTEVDNMVNGAAPSLNIGDAVNAWNNVLTDNSSLLEGAVGRILNDNVYQQLKRLSIPYGSTDGYLRSVVGGTTNVTLLADYYDTKRTDGAAILGSLAGTDVQFAIVAGADPVGVLNSFKTVSGADDILTGAFEATEGFTLTNILGKLVAVNSTDYASVTLQPSLDYHKFFLAEHHLYGSDRLGIKTYWPNEYKYEWDASKTPAENQTLLNNSEFTYRRAWYSNDYNSLINYGALLPWGNQHGAPIYAERFLGQKRYELTDHLGNVKGVVTDKVISSPGIGTTAVKRASLFSAYDHYPFGMLMPNRYIEDESEQCAVVTKTRYVKQNQGWVIDLSTQDHVNHYTSGNVGTVLMGKIVSPGPGGSVEAEGPVGDVAVMNGTFSSAYLSAGKEINIETQVENFDPGDPVTVELKQLDVATQEMRVLASTTTDRRNVVSLTGEAVSSEPFVIAYTSSKLGGKFGVGWGSFNVVDVVQEQYWVIECNEDDNFRADYRFGYNGMHKDNELKGIGNNLDFGARMQDSRLARFLSLDPLTKKFPSYSPYLYAANNPIFYIDDNGEKKTTYYTIIDQRTNAVTKLTVATPGLVSQSRKSMYSEIKTFDWYDTKQNVTVTIDKEGKAQMKVSPEKLGKFRASTFFNLEWTAKLEAGEYRTKDNRSFGGWIGTGGSGSENQFEPKAGKGAKYVDYATVLNAMSMISPTLGGKPEGVLGWTSYLTTWVNGSLDENKPTSPITINAAPKPVQPPAKVDDDTVINISNSKAQYGFESKTVKKSEVGTRYKTDPNNVTINSDTQAK